DSAHGLNQPRAAAHLGLPPQVADVHVEGVRCEAEVVTPDSLEDDRAREHLPWVRHEELEQGKLRAGELDGLPAAANLARSGIELEIGELQALVLAVGCTPQQRTDSAHALC